MKHSLKLLTFAFLLSLCSVSSSQAQSKLPVHLSTFLAGGDTLDVSLNIGSIGDSLETGIWAFQFDVQAEAALELIGVETLATLSQKTGWTVSFNRERMRVAGFSSSRDAIEVGGTLVVFRVLQSGDIQAKGLCIEPLRLNSGDPAAIPAIPCTPSDVE